jgi:hypothetical protein
MGFIVILTWICIGAVCAYYAKQRGRRAPFWFFIGLFLGILGLLLLFILPSQQEESLPEAPIKEPLAHSKKEEKSVHWYYIDEQTQKQEGPMSFTAVERAHKEGRVGLSTFVWSTEMEGWKSFGEVSTPTS